MTAGRFLETVLLVKGNGTSTTSPNSKGIVDVVVRVAPDRGQSRRARGRSGAREGAVLFARPDEINEVLDLGNPLGGQRLYLLDQGLSVGGQDGISLA